MERVLREVEKKQLNGNRSKIVFQFSMFGEFIREYPSAKEVKRQLGYSQGHISECCRGELKSAYGYIWKYKEKEEDV